MSGIVGTSHSKSTVVGKSINRTARVWCLIDGTGTPSITDSYNCSSIADIGNGDYRITFQTAMQDATYPFAISGRYVSWYTCFCAVEAPATTTFRVGVSDAHPVSSTNGGGWNDLSHVCFTIFGE